MTPPVPVANPLREGLRVGGASEPALFTIFGATGDLAQRKLLPAIYNLAKRGLLPPRFGVVGYARTDMTDDGFRRFAKAAIESHSRTAIDEKFWPAFASMLHYHAGGFDDPQHFHALARTLSGLDKEIGGGAHRVFYLSTPASFFPVIVTGLSAARLSKPAALVRVVIEKPFGHDLRSAQELAEIVHRGFREQQVFRIDHYLGKETVQNIYAFRFANAIFEPIWSNSYVDHVQITVAESLGVEHRAAFYEETGVVRDIVQNHLLQVLALVAMEPPAAFEPEPVRDEKAKVLRAAAAAGVRVDRARPVRGRLRGGRAGGRLPAGAERAARLDHAHLHRRQARDRQLAVGGNAVLHPHRQTAGQARDRGGRTVPAAAPPALLARGGRAPRGQLAGAADPARRGHLAAVRRQGADADAARSEASTWTSSTAPRS